MRRVERSATLPATPEEVFAFVSELGNLPRWQSGVISARRTSAGPMGQGATAHVVRDVMGRRVEAPLRVTAYRPPRQLSVQSTVSGVRATATLELTPAEQGTLARLAMEIRASGLTAFMEPMIAAGAGGELDASLERLRSVFARDR